MGIYGCWGGDPSNMLIVPTESVVAVAACPSTCTTVFVSKDGKLYSGHYNGEDRGSLRQVDLKGRKVIDATIYKEMVIYVTEAGEVLTQALGGGEEQLLPVLQPKKTCSHGQEEKGKRVRVKAVTAGVNHIIFQSTQDELWAQGRGPALGLFTNKIENEITNPARIDFFKGRRVLQIKSGAYFTIALVETLSLNQQTEMLESDHLPDLESCVRSCEQCRKETGDRILFQDHNLEKCPLGLAVKKDCKTLGRLDVLSPTPSSGRADDVSSRNSGVVDDGESSDFNQEELELTSGDVSCENTGVNTPDEDKITCRSHRKSDGSEFEIVDCNEEDDCDRTVNASAGKGLFLNADAARQYITRQLSWMTTNSVDYVDLAWEGTEKLSYKYPIDTATVILKENVANAANSAASLVATGVKTVSDKVGQISRHFSSGDCVENDRVDRYYEEDNFEMDIALDSSAAGVLKKSNTFECNSLPRKLSKEMIAKKTHTRTGSGSVNYPRLVRSSTPMVGKEPEQISSNINDMIHCGRNLLNAEVWAWGTSNKGQLGLNDLNHQSTPTNVQPLNHQGITKIVCGTHHTAALTLDGQVFVWGSNDKGQAGASTSPSISSPQRLHIPDSKLARDVAAGDNFLALITLDGLVYYLGTLKEGTPPVITLLEVGNCTQRFSSILCSAESIVCTEEDFHPKVLEYIETESIYLQLLNQSIQLIMKPMLTLTSSNNNNANKPSKNTSSPGGNSAGRPQNLALLIQQSKTELFEAFINLTYAMATCVQAANRDDVTDVASTLPIIYQVEELTSLYRSYSTCLCNVLAVSGTTLDSKDANDIVDKCRGQFTDLVPESKAGTCNELFVYLLLVPLNRIQEYECFLHALQNDAYSPFTLDRIKMAHTHWKQTNNALNKNKIEAEETQKYWETCSIKMYEALATPRRRVIRDSRTHPITVHNAGRFSSHSFVLLCDVLVHVQYSNFSTYALDTMWVETVPSNSSVQNGLMISLPEDTVMLVCPSNQEKSRWLFALHEATKQCVDPTWELDVVSLRAPPLVRTAKYVFTKHPQYKDAKYEGQWFCGKLHGEGTLTWPDGRRFKGQFSQNVYQGFGRLEIPSTGSASEKTVYEGMWRNGKLEGIGIIRYENKDIYSGYLKDSLPHGHGELKKGRFSSEAASVYIGEWIAGIRSGYGVLDDIAQGEKYLGMWYNNQRHGPGMVVTMNGVYYEGNFVQNKLTGYGLMIGDDGIYYEGELGPGGSFNGKGRLYYPGGDLIEGTFAGTWADGIKINGLLQRGGTVMLSEEAVLPTSFGKLSVTADEKWVGIFRQCRKQLGLVDGQQSVVSKVWEALASHISKERQLSLKTRTTTESIEGLDRIPNYKDDLTYRNFSQIQDYLGKALSSRLHPLGQAVLHLVDAFRATYGGVVAHPRLLTYAVQEVQAITSRLYALILLLFPNLPPENGHAVLEPPDDQQDDLIFTASLLIHPWLLPHLYSPLSTLYVLHNHKADEDYLQRLLKWNKQPDIALMTFLGVDVKFWLRGEDIKEGSRSLAAVKDAHFCEAVETLQLLSTSFTPKDKLALIYSTFQKLSKSVTQQLGQSYNLCMDDLFPLFQYVVVRSRIQHLGAEIHFIEDLMDEFLQHGELGLMFTTLKACYMQIRLEKIITAL